MKKAKRLIVLAVVLLMLISGAVTVYAMTEEQETQSAARQSIPSEYAAEEMAVGAYYENWTPEAELDLV